MAEKLGVDLINLGPLHETWDGGAFVDATIDSYRNRVAIVLDPAATWPVKPAPGWPAVNLPDKYRLERERAEVEAADARRRATVEQRHYDALDHLAEGVVTAAAVTGCTPAWVVGAQAIDQARADRGRAGADDRSRRVGARAGRHRAADMAAAPGPLHGLLDDAERRPALHALRRGRSISRRRKQPAGPAPRGPRRGRRPRGRAVGAGVRPRRSRGPGVRRACAAPRRAEPAAAGPRRPRECRA